jgi:hypothetical protein
VGSLGKEYIKFEWIHTFPKRGADATKGAIANEDIDGP